MKAHIPFGVLFLHAFPLSKEMFSEQFTLLEKEGIPYVALDYPGFGDEPPLAGEVSIRTLTDFVVSRINSLGVRKLIPVGVSMGGYIMFELWRRYRELIKALVFVATRAEGETPEGRKARYDLIGRVRKEGTSFLIETMLEIQTSPKTKTDEDKVRKLICIMEKASSEGIVKTLRALADREDSSGLLNQIDVPTLVVAGKDDEKVTPPDIVKRIADGITGAEFVVLEDSAHLPPFENPPAFNEALIGFLKKIID